jgi:hypothetical protein
MNSKSDLIYCNDDCYSNLFHTNTLPAIDDICVQQLCEPPQVIKSQQLEIALCQQKAFKLFKKENMSRIIFDRHKKVTKLLPIRHLNNKKQSVQIVTSENRDISFW